MVGRPLSGESIAAVEAAIYAGQAAQEADNTLRKAYNAASLALDLGPGNWYGYNLDQPTALRRRGLRVIKTVSLSGRVAIGSLDMPDNKGLSPIQTAGCVAELTPLTPNTKPNRQTPLRQLSTQQAILRLSVTALTEGGLYMLNTPEAEELVDAGCVVGPAELAAIYDAAPLSDVYRLP